MNNMDLTLPKGTVIPNHIAIILDGNRRWARARGLKPWEGHKAGYETVKKLTRACRQLGVHTFTIWAFSTENWERPKIEINELFRLLKKGLKELEKECHEHRVRIIHLGRKDRFPKDLADEIRKVELETKDYKNHVLNLALDYGGKDEITRAIRKIIENKVPAEEIEERLIESYLDTARQPYPNPDLFIRTSGEQRASGLLPWQMTYAEYYFEPEHLPNFTPEKLKGAILDYSRRRRRFGGNDKVKHLSFEPKLAAKLEVQWWRLQNIPEGTKFKDYAHQHIREQFGLSKSLAIEAAKLFVEAIAEGKHGKWKKAVAKLKEFYEIIKTELKLTFEPSLVASLEVQLWQKTFGKNRIESISDAEDLAKEYYAEVYRVSLFQATKAAHLRILALREHNMAERGLGEEHWEKSEDYLRRFYSALREQVA